MGIGYATVDGFYALTGCANPETIGDRGCDGVSVTYTHVNVEALEVLENLLSHVHRIFPR